MIRIALILLGAAFGYTIGKKKGHVEMRIAAGKGDPRSVPSWYRYLP